MRATEFLAPCGDLSRWCPPLELSECATISLSITLAFVVHDTRNVPYSAWGRKARSECPAKCPQFAYAFFRYFAGDPGPRREGGGLYYHARGTSPDRGCLGSFALFRSVPNWRLSRVRTCVPRVRPLAGGGSAIGRCRRLTLGRRRTIISLVSRRCI